MSGNKRSSQFPVSAAYQTGPVVEPDADFDARSTTWVERGRARQQRATNRLAIVAGVLAVSAAVVYALFRFRRSAADEAKPAHSAPSSRDHDGSKGAIEDESPSEGTNAPGLDHNGMPNDERAITEDALGARLDGTQG
jgi:hypothetical protein